MTVTLRRQPNEIRLMLPAAGTSRPRETAYLSPPVKRSMFMGGPTVQS